MQTCFLTVWAEFDERQRDGPKFVVAERPSKQTQRVACAESPEMVAEMRKSKKSATDWLDGEPLDLEELTVQSESSSALMRLFDA